MQIYAYNSMLMNSKMYVLVEDEEAILIDPCISRNAQILLKGKNVKKIIMILTHEHYDHISGVNWWKKEYEHEVICSCMCAENIKNTKKTCQNTLMSFRTGIRKSWIR